MKKKIVLIDPSPSAPNKRNHVNLPLLSIGNHVKTVFPEFEVEIVDFRFESPRFLKDGGLQKALEDASVIGMTCCFSAIYLHTIETAKVIRGIYPHVPVIIGGLHATILPHDFSKYPDLFDYVISGPGEFIIEQIVSTLQHHNFSRPPQTRHVNSASMPAKINPKLSDWTLLKKYFSQNDITPIIMMKFTGGCPQRCHFCSNSGPYKHDFYQVPVSEAFNQLRQVLDFVTKNASKEMKKYLEREAAVGIADEIFGRNPDWQQKFLMKLIEERYNLPFEDFDLNTQVRLDLFRQSDAKLFDQARANVGFGIESLDPSILLRMNKSKNPNRFLKNFSNLFETPNYILKNTYYALMMVHGFPSENASTISLTTTRLKQLLKSSHNPLFINHSLFLLFPGTLVYNNMYQYTTLYGSQFHFPTWWNDELGFIEQGLTDPSENFSCRALYEWFLNEVPPMLDECVARSDALGGPAAEVLRKMHRDWKNTLRKLKGIVKIGENLIQNRNIVPLTGKKLEASLIQ